MIDKIKNKYPNYDFSKFVYNGYYSNSIVICDKGHEFNVKYSNLLRGTSCPLCRKEDNAEEKINKMKQLEPAFDFSKFKYSKNSNKSIIICDKGHEFEMSYANFMKGQRCKKCYYDNIRFSQDYIIEKMKELEPKYDFSKFVYKNNNELGTVICDKGHKYNVSFKAFNKGHRCRICSNENKKISPEIAIANLKRIRPEFDFSNFVYKNSSTKSIIICDKGHEFENTYNKLMLGSGCYYCSRGSKKDQDYIIEKMKELEPKYDFSKFAYKGCDIKSIIVCDKGHEYESNWSKFRLGCRCPICSASKTVSKAEVEIKSFIESFYYKNIETSNRKELKYSVNDKETFMEIDIYLPDIKFGLEYDGDFFHSDEFINFRSKGKFTNADDYHNFKDNLAKDRGIDILHIKEKDYINNKEEIFNIIKKEITKRLS